MNFYPVKRLSDLMLLQVGHSEKGIMREAGQLTNASNGQSKAS